MTSGVPLQLVVTANLAIIYWAGVNFVRCQGQFHPCDSDKRSEYGIDVS